jgi:hypothetical protein
MTRLSMATVGLAASLALGTCAFAQDAGEGGPTVRREGDRLEVSEPIRFKGKEVHPDSLVAIAALAEYLVAHPEMQLRVVVGDPGVKDRDKAMEHTRHLAQRIVYALEDCWIGEGRVTPMGLGYASQAQVVFPIVAPAAEPRPQPVTAPDPSSPAVTVASARQDRGPPTGSSDEEPPAPGEDFCSAFNRVVEAASEGFGAIRTGDDGVSVSLPGARSCSMAWVTYSCPFLVTHDRAAGEARFEELRGELMHCLPWTWAYTDEPTAVDVRFFMALGKVGAVSVQVSLGLLEPLSPGDPYRLRVWIEKYRE